MGTAVEGIVQEVDIETGEVLFEWHSLEHVGIEESYSEPPEQPEFDLDYFHLNSIDVDLDDNLIVSARSTFAVYKIDRESGKSSPLPHERLARAAEERLHGAGNRRRSGFTA